MVALAGLLAGEPIQIVPDGPGQEKQPQVEADRKARLIVSPWRRSREAIAGLEAFASALSKTYGASWVFLECLDQRHASGACDGMHLARELLNLASSEFLCTELHDVRAAIDAYDDLLLPLLALLLRKELIEARKAQRDADFLRGVAGR